MSLTCIICGEFERDDTSDAHDAADIAELLSWRASPVYEEFKA